MAHTTSNKRSSISSAATAADDPTTLLARGYIARFLPSRPLQILSPDEIDKDLRHFQAYRSAVISYRQQYYLAVNQSLLVEAGTNNNNKDGVYHASSSSSSIHHHHQQQQQPSPLTSLPVRLDPEEEKRVSSLRKKILKAEFLREEMEQHYVALRAHFVQASQELQQAFETRSDCIEFLQSVVQQRGRAVGLMRAKLQMARDVLAVLTHRSLVLEQHEALNRGGTTTTSEANQTNNQTANNPNNSSSTSPVPPPTPPPHVSDSDDPLTDVWNQLEESMKQQVGKASTTTTTTTTKTSKKPMKWPCIKEPSTPRGVPLLLSTLAHPESAPEKSIAYSINQAFGSNNKDSLVWFTNHLQPAAEDDDEDAEEEEEEELAKKEQLQEEADFLQAELDNERIENEKLWQKITNARVKNDEWVAMICLVRQETEAVLFRHNIVMESEQAQEAAERRYMESVQERAKNADGGGGEKDGMNGDDGDAQDDLGVDKPIQRTDDDNDGDDEGSNDEEEEVGWERKKRAAAEEENTTRKKARRGD
jgi:hypothetical protein